jgi:cullin-associated NEDD8-dissociated protein 1
MESFNSATEETKTVASYALGGLATGNPSKYLPILLNEIKTKPKRQYLLLHALKEVSFVSCYMKQFVSR